MRRLLATAALAAVVAACGIDHGYVTAKRDVAAHDESYVEQIYMGQSCYKSGKTEYCSPRYMYLPATRHVARECFVSLQNEKETGERSIDCGSWEATKINDQVTLK